MGIVRTLRYGRAWVGDSARVREQTLELDREGHGPTARLVLPATGRPPHPGWILLHGVTRPGLDHPRLVRFSRAVAATGAAVLLPEVPEWRALHLAPEAALPTVEAAVRALDSLEVVRGPRYGLMGFSFGAPQALVTASAESVRDRLAGVVAFGGYCDLERTLAFMLLGEHAWKGRSWRVRPDAYGRWIVGANYLTEVPGLEDATDVAAALHRLATEAGDRQVPSDDPRWTDLKRELTAGMPASRRTIFEVFAPLDPERHDTGAARALLAPLAEAARGRSPLMDPAPHIGPLPASVELLHGRGDRLIPFTESHRMFEALRDRGATRLTVTRLFAHSEEAPFPIARGPWELLVFARALGRVLDTV